MFSRPAYQAFVQRTGERTTPDVAMVADPNTGVAVYTIAPSTGQGFWQVLGGTSLSAQLFGGLVAIADQGRATPRGGHPGWPQPDPSRPLLTPLVRLPRRDPGLDGIPRRRLATTWPPGEGRSPRPS